MTWGKWESTRMAKAAKPATTKALAASAKGDKAPAQNKAKAPAKTDGGTATANGATAAEVSLKQMAGARGGTHARPKRQDETRLGECGQTLAEHLQQGSKIRIPGLGIFQVSAR